MMRHIIDEAMIRDLKKIGLQYVEDGDYVTFEWECSKLAFIFSACLILSEKQHTKVDNRYRNLTARLMKDVTQEINASAQARDQEDDL